MSTSLFYTALGWISYLHHPPPSSWIARTAATFRILALLLILPCIFLTALDVASYLVVRTLGTESADRLGPIPATAPESKLESTSGPPLDHELHKPPTIVISPHFDVSAAGETHTETFFATSSDANFALAGEGIFSPPGSRPASPPILRNSVAACCDGTAEGEDITVLRKRG